MEAEMTKRTLDVVWRIIAWSFNAILSGSRPTTSWNGFALRDGGGPLASGWRGALCQIRGDWAFYAEVFGFPQWNSALRMCWMCKASSTIRHLAWTRFGADAGWRETRWTHTSYLDYLRGANLVVPALLTAFVGFRLECVMVDVLHTVDQGVASHIIGNVFWLIAVQRLAFGRGSREEIIKRLDKHLRGWYSRTRCESHVQGKLTVDRVRTSGGWPKLKAKAAATRHLAAYALHLARTFGRAEDRLVIAVCTLLCEFYSILENESMFLSEPARSRLPEVGRQLAVLYTQLAEESTRSRLRMWKMHPKLHIFVHLCEWQALDWGNPRYYWTYADEDLVGLITEVSQSCHPATLACVALFKWLHVYFE